jgi:hypothetical protein
MLYIIIAVVVSVGPHFRHWYTGKRSAPCCAERFLFLCAFKHCPEFSQPDGLLIDPDLPILRFQRGKFARSRVLDTSRFSGSIILSSKAADDHRISL